MKKLRLRPWVKNTIGVILFYSLIVVGCLLIEARYDQLCENGYTQYCSVESEG